MNSNTKTVDMLHGPMFSKILIFAIPLALSSILQLLFNAADTIVVGQFAGSEALAAVGSNGALINLLVNAFLGLSTGVNVIVSRYRGQGNDKKISLTIHTAILVSVICGAILAVFGYFVAPELLKLMSTPENVIDLSTIYLKIYFLGMPFMMLYNFGAAILRSVGDTKRPLIFLTIAGVINVALNLLFVIVFNMSVAGVALATVISQIVSSILVTRSLCHETGALKLNLRNLHIDKDCLKEIVRVGLPAGLQGCIFSLSNVVIQSTINTFGSTIVAGNSAAGNVEGFIYVTMNSFHQACVTFSSQNYGAKQFDRCDRAYMISGACAITVGIVMGFTFILFGEQLLGLYTTDPAVIEAGLARMEILFKFQFINGFMDISVAALRGIGYSLLPTIISLTGVCALRLVYVATIFQLNPTIHMLYLVYPISWVITASAQLICYLICRKRVRKQFNQSVAEA